MLRQCLVNLAEKADLTDALSVELAIARSKIKVRDRKISWNQWTWKEGTKPTSNCWKAKLCTAYSWYCKVHKVQWEDRPSYKQDEKSVQPPNKQAIQRFIDNTHGELALKLQVSGETGLRPIEVTGQKGIKVKDLHLDERTITATNTKRCNARPPLKITEELKQKLLQHISRKNLQPDDPIFKSAPETYGKDFRRLKKRLARDFKDPTIAGVKLYHIRHYYITLQCLKFQNVEIVRQQVGHKNLNTTQRYMHITINQSIEYATQKTKDVNRAEQLLIAGFTYQLTSPDGYMIFRIPKEILPDNWNSLNK